MEITNGVDCDTNTLKREIERRGRRIGTFPKNISQIG